MILRLGFVLIGALLPISCSASPLAQSCTPDHTLGAERIGPIQLGSSMEQVRKDFSVSASRLPYSDILGAEVTLCDGAASVLVDTDAVRNIISISTTSTLFETGSGGRVGMSLSQLQALHPNGVVSTGVEESGWIAFLPKKTFEYFEFSIDGAEHACLQDNQYCDSDFYQRTAIRYWVSN